MSVRTVLRFVMLAAGWLAMGVVGAGPASAGGSLDWPTWRGDSARSAHTREALPATLNLQWMRRLEPPAPAWPSSQEKIRFDVSYEPVVAGQRLFIGSMSTDRICAYDTETGAELWRFYTEGPVRFAPVVWRDNVYVGSDDGLLYCLDAATGRCRWSVLGGPDRRMVLGNERLIGAWPVRGAPVLDESADGEATLYFGAGIWPFMGIFLHAVDARTGAVRWTNSGSGSMLVMQQHESPAFAGVAPQGYLAVAGRFLLVSGGRTVPAVYELSTGGFVHFGVASRAFGKAAGGYAVSAMGEYYFNNGCLYQTTNGAPVLDLNNRSVVAGWRVDRIGAGFAGVAEDGVSFYGAPPTQAAMTAVDSNGRVGRSPATPMPRVWTVETGVRTERVHFQAGDRWYVSGPKGWIGAVDIPPMPRPGLSWSSSVPDSVWTLVPGAGKLFVVTRRGVVCCFGADRPVGAPVSHGKVEGAGSAVPLPLVGSNGYALVWGLGTDALARVTGLAVSHHVIAVDADRERVNELRRGLDAAGIYGRRVQVLAGEPGRLLFPPYIASRIEIGDGLLNDPAVGERIGLAAWRALRPYGGVAEARGVGAGPWARIGAGLAGLGARVEVAEKGAVTRVVRAGALPGSASWTHEGGDVANTLTSQDEWVKPPLGLLWFGGLSNEDILPRHGHGPSPQIVGGRLFIEGPDIMRAVDVYTGRLLWQREFEGLGQYYDSTTHQPGANEIGGNYVSQMDGVYVVHEGHCLRLDPATGRTMTRFVLPHAAGEAEPYWGYVGVYGDVLLAGGSPVSIKVVTKDEPAQATRNAPYGASSVQLIAMDRHSGAVLWERRARQMFRHNAIAAGGGKVFCVDAISQAHLDWLGRRGETPAHSGVLLALDARTGKPAWSKGSRVFGTCLSYSKEQDLVLESGSPGADRAMDEAAGLLAAYRGADGTLLWRAKAQYVGRPMVSGATIYTDGAAFDLLSGQPRMREDPLTGLLKPWRFSRQHGCNTPIAGRHMLLFRSAAAGFYDLGADAGTGNWGGFKSGCTMNLIPADGVLSAPDYTRTCTCSYQNQCSLALVPMEDVESWTYPFGRVAIDDAAKGGLRGEGEDGVPGVSAPVMSDRLLQVGVNFGAPGDWQAAGGSLWLEYPAMGGTGPNLGIQVEGFVSYYCEHASGVTGVARQVTASGLTGAAVVRIPVRQPEVRPYTVRLYFAELAASRAGERYFDVWLQGKPVLTRFDPFVEAGGARRSLVKEFCDVGVGAALSVELRPGVGSLLPPQLCGLELIWADPVKVGFAIEAGVDRPAILTEPNKVKAVVGLTNRTDKALLARVTVQLDGKNEPARSVELLARSGMGLAYAVPVEVLNRGRTLDVALDAGAEFAGFRVMNEHFPLEVEVPLSVEISASSANQAEIHLRSLATLASMTFRLTAQMDGMPVLKQEVSLAAEQQLTVPCVVPKDLAGLVTEWDLSAQWPLEVMPATGRFSRKLDLREVRRIPKALKPAKPAVTLGRQSGLFSVEKREALRGKDDLEAELAWSWNGDSLFITVQVADDIHINNGSGDLICNGDCLQIGIAPMQGAATIFGLALNEEGVQFWRFAGADKTLSSRAKYRVSRNELTETTRYELQVPLSAVGVRALPHTLFRLNIVVFDDDTGGGQAYWRQLGPGLAGKFQVLDYPVFSLGEDSGHAK